MSLFTLVTVEKIFGLAGRFDMVIIKNMQFILAKMDKKYISTFKCKIHFK